MRYMVAFVISMFVSLSAFAQVTWIDHEAAALLNSMDQCAHNDAGKIGSFEVKTFDAKAAMMSVLSEQEENRGVCSNAQRKVSDRTQVVTEFRNLMKDKNVTYCTKKEWPYRQSTEDRLADFIGDPTNLLSFASVYTEDFVEGELDSSESCMYYNFYVFRANGTAVKFTVNYTD
ncbi:MAG: hypothetical protein V4760_19665 [Bdellovibrionota bacterium]